MRRSGSRRRLCSWPQKLRLQHDFIKLDFLESSNQTWPLLLTFIYSLSLSFSLLLFLSIYPPFSLSHSFNFLRTKNINWNLSTLYLQPVWTSNYQPSFLNKQNKFTNTSQEKEATGGGEERKGLILSPHCGTSLAHIICTNNHSIGHAMYPGQVLGTHRSCC